MLDKKGGLNKMMKSATFKRKRVNKSNGLSQRNFRCPKQ